MLGIVASGYIEQVKLDLAILDTAFTNNQYTIFITKALNKINTALCLSGENELSINASGIITPELNNRGIYLLVTALECMIQGQKSIKIINNNGGIRVRDADQEIDTSAGFTEQRAMAQSLCNDFDKTIAHIIYIGCSIIKNKDDNVPGKMVWYGNSRIFANMDHSGDGDGSTRDFSSPFDSS